MQSDNSITRITSGNHEISERETREAYRRSMLEKAVDLSKEGLKTVILLNGAGAAGMLALIGQALERNTHLVASLTTPLGLFASGAFVGGVATAGAYWSQLEIANSVDKPVRSIRVSRVYKATLGMVLLSYLLFITAAGWAYCALSHVAPADVLPGPG